MTSTTRPQPRSRDRETTSAEITSAAPTLEALVARRDALRVDADAARASADAFRTAIARARLAGDDGMLQQLRTEQAAAARQAQECDDALQLLTSEITALEAAERDTAVHAAERALEDAEAARVDAERAVATCFAECVQALDVVTEQARAARGAEIVAYGKLEAARRALEPGRPVYNTAPLQPFVRFPGLAPALEALRESGVMRAAWLRAVASPTSTPGAV